MQMRQGLALLRWWEVRGDGKHADFAGGLGDGGVVREWGASRRSAGDGSLPEIYGGPAAALREDVDGGGAGSVAAGPRDVSGQGDVVPDSQLRGRRDLCARYREVHGEAGSRAAGDGGTDRAAGVLAGRDGGDDGTGDSDGAAALWRGTGSSD